jgi:hypothetical protein
MAGAEKETFATKSMVEIVRVLPVLESPDQFLAILEGGPPCLPANELNVNMVPHTALDTCSSAASRTQMFDRPHAQLPTSCVGILSWCNPALCHALNDELWQLYDANTRLQVPQQPA